MREKLCIGLLVGLNNEMKAYKLSSKDMVCVHELLLFTWNKNNVTTFVSVMQCHLEVLDW